MIIINNTIAIFHFHLYDRVSSATGVKHLQIGMTVLTETKRRVILALTDVWKAIWKQKKMAQPPNLT